MQSPTISNARPPQRRDFRLFRVALLAVVIGLSAGIIAYLLFHLIALFSNLFFFGRISLELPNLQENQLGLAVILVTTLGGLVVGVMGKYGSDKIRGHGIPEAMEAVLTKNSRIQPRVAFLKPISAALAIGTGGPFGAEGPIIQTGGAFGSLVGQALHTTPAERKVLLACGAAAGMAATFNTPIAAIILAIELLLFEFKSRSFIPLAIASAVATGVHIVLLGDSAMFTVGVLNFDFIPKLPFYLVLSVVCGLAAVAISKTLYWVEDRFDHLPFDPMWYPAIAGMILGIIGFFVPRVLGVGYETISDILNNRLPLVVLLSVMVFKAAVMIITLGSGTSGGLLAPTFMSSAAMGAAFATIVNTLLPGTNLDPAAFALVAMAAVFGAASRATFAFIIFAFEITRDYHAILPLTLICVIADAVARRFSENSIMTEKLVRRGVRVQQEYEASVLDTTRVSAVMTTNPATISETMSVQALMERINANDPAFTRHQALLIVDSDGCLSGIVTRSDLLGALHNGHTDHTVLEAGTRDLIIAYPDDSVRDALNRMLSREIGRLPVVTHENPREIVGYLSRGNVISAHLKHLTDETNIESGWLQGRLASRFSER